MHLPVATERRGRPENGLSPLVRNRTAQSHDPFGAARRGCRHSPTFAPAEDTRLGEKTTQAGNLARRRVERFRKTVIGLSIDIKNPPVEKGLLRSRECAMEHKIGNRPALGSCGLLQSEFILRRQAQVELFASGRGLRAGGTGRHGFFLSGKSSISCPT